MCGGQKGAGKTPILLDMEKPFNEIVLSRGENKALKLLCGHCLIAEDVDAKKEANRLVRLELAERFHTTYNGQPRIGIRLTERGKDYFMYLDREEKRKRRQSIRYWITTGIAIAALILSVAALLWQTYTWRYVAASAAFTQETVRCNTIPSTLVPFFQDRRSNDSGMC